MKKRKKTTFSIAVLTVLFSITGFTNAFASDGTYAGPTFTVNDNTYRMISEKSGTIAFVEAKNEETVTVPASLSSDTDKLTVVRIESDAFKGDQIRTVTICSNVETIDRNAFRDSGATELIIKSRKLTQDSVEGSLSNSSIKTVSIETRADFYEEYRSYFSKKNAGKKVRVKFSPELALPLPEGTFTITSEVGKRESPGGIGSTNHKGLDLAAPTGTPIYTSLDGTVKLAGKYYGYGNCVIVDSGDIEIIYGHMSSINCQKEDIVARGQQIGAVGSTGTSTGPHLHFEMHQDGKIMDPEPVLGLR